MYSPLIYQNFWQILNCSNMCQILNFVQSLLVRFGCWFVGNHANMSCWIGSWVGFSDNCQLAPLNFNYFIKTLHENKRAITQTNNAIDTQKNKILNKKWLQKNDTNTQKAAHTSKTKKPKSCWSNVNKKFQYHVMQTFLFLTICLSCARRKNLSYNDNI